MTFFTFLFRYIYRSKILLRSDLKIPTYWLRLWSSGSKSYYLWEHFAG